MGLAEDLAELERTDPAVRAAAENLERVKREIVQRALTDSFVDVVLSVACDPCQRDPGKACANQGLANARMVCVGRIRRAAAKYGKPTTEGEQHG
jgi:hypothetical protein